MGIRSVAFVGDVFNVSGNFGCGSDCSRLVTSAVACRPVTLRLWSGFLVWLL